MGYYTQFSLSIHADINEDLLGDSRRREVVAWLKEQADKNDDGYWSAFTTYAADSDPEFKETWSCRKTIKWYGHDQDMKELSLRFPDVCFLLEGEGEEEDDKWKKYYLNGKVCVCQARIQITYPEFSLDRMESIPEEKS